MARQDYRFRFTHRVRWHEVDPQRVAYAGAYLNWLTTAEVEYFRHLGVAFYRLGELGIFDSVIRKVTLEYLAPARLDEVVEVCARYAHLGRSSLLFQAEMFRPGEEEPLCRGEMHEVGVDPATLRPIPIPEDLRALITHFEATGEALPLERFPSLLPARA